MVHVPAYPICTLDDVRDELRIAADDGSYDTRIDRLIGSVSTAIESYCGQVFVARDFATQLHDGDDSISLLLKKIPVLSVSAVLIDDVAVAAANYTVYPDSGMLVLTEGETFTKGYRNVSVTYRAGYEDGDIPADVAMAARIWVCHNFKIMDKQRWGVGSSSTQDESFSFAPGTMPDEVRQVLDMYRVWR